MCWVLSSARKHIRVQLAYLCFFAKYTFDRRKSLEGDVNKKFKTSCCKGRTGPGFHHVRCDHVIQSRRRKFSRFKIATNGQLDARSARASQHGISASRSKTSPTTNFVIYPQAFTFHLHDRIFPFIHSWDIEPACFSQEIQGSPLLRGAHPINRENQAASRLPSSRNAHETRPLTTQDARHAKTRRR